MNERGGVINIIVAIIIVTFVLLALMQPILSLTDVANEQITTLNSHDRYAKDINGTTVQMSNGGASLGEFTMTLLYGLGFIFLLGLVIYIVRYGPNRPPAQPQGGMYP